MIRLLTGKWTHLTSSVKEMGPIPIKISQWLSQKEELIGRDMCKALEPLRDNGKAHSLAWTHKLCRKSGLKLTNISKEPVGIGSVAQVHTAQYRHRKVAIKVMHPGTIRSISIDVALAKGFLALMQAVPILPIPNIMNFDSFIDTLLRQLNFKVEGHNTTKLARMFSDNSMIHFPDILYADTNIIIETFVPGMPLAEFQKKYGKKVAIKAKAACLSAYLHMWLSHGFVHGDCHDGNILYTMPRGINGHPHVSFIDCGVVSKISSAISTELLSVLPAFRTGELTVLMEFLDKLATNEYDKRLARSVMKKHSATVPELMKTRKFPVSAQVKMLLTVMEEGGVIIDSDIVSVLLGYVVIESNFTSKPGFDLLDISIRLIMLNRKFKSARPAIKKLHEARTKIMGLSQKL